MITEEENEYLMLDAEVVTEEEKKHLLLEIEAMIEAYVDRIASEEAGIDECIELTNSTYEKVKAKMNRIWGDPNRR